MFTMSFSFTGSASFTRAMSRLNVFGAETTEKEYELREHTIDACVFWYRLWGIRSYYNRKVSDGRKGITSCWSPSDLYFFHDALGIYPIIYWDRDLLLGRANLQGLHKKNLRRMESPVLPRDEKKLPCPWPWTPFWLGDEQRRRHLSVISKWTCFKLCVDN